MTQKFHAKKFAEQLLRFSPRQGVNETKTANFIMKELSARSLSFTIHHFKTTIPDIQDARLIVDGHSIICKGSAFHSGTVMGKNDIVSSLASSDDLARWPNINFNPRAKAISRPIFYFAPAVAVSRKDLSKVLNGESVRAEVKVKPKAHRSMNILVGNSVSPKTIVFAHYDSIDDGAVDNASGVATMLRTMLMNPETLQTTLYIFSGNEELSYHGWPIYWGHGFREFEKKYKRQMVEARKLIAIDSLGNGKTIVSRDENMIYLAFPISHMKEWKEKIRIICGSIDKLMEVYHSEADKIGQLKEKYLIEGSELLAREISRVR